MAISISGNTSNVIYSKGDIALSLTPYDNYRLFTLYDDWSASDRKPIDLSGSQKMYLVFKSGKKEIRIPECDSTSYPVDKVNGQVLFKINQKNAISILSMESKVFYITRVYEISDISGNKTFSSDEEVLYTGVWQSEGTGRSESLTSQVKKLNDLVAERDKTISNLQTTNAELMKRNIELSTQLEELREIEKEHQSRIDELETNLAEYESGETLEGTVISDKATYYKIMSNEQLTEEQMLDLLINQENKLQK